MPPAARIPVAVLGATGAVGQTFARLLADHPWFELTAVAASERSAGRRYAEAAQWIEGEMPPAVRDLVVLPSEPGAVPPRLVFSALDASVAGEVESAFAAAGRVVLSNARTHRMAPDVPLLIPEINAGHLALLERQRRERGWSGALLTNPNCSTIVIALALAPLHQAVGVEHLFVTTLQAVSGAGYPGVPSLDILGNVVPFIGGEEEKIQTETLKILGDLNGDAVRAAPIAVSAHTNRVPVQHGHTACMSIRLREPLAPEDARALLREWRGAVHGLALPTAPTPPLIVSDEPARPQPRRDADAGGGMTVTIGRVRPDPILDLRLVATGHNTVRGAAGASILNAELMVARGLVAT